MYLKCCKRTEVMYVFWTLFKDLELHFYVFLSAEECYVNLL